MKFAHLSGCHPVHVTSYRQNQMGISIQVSRLIVRHVLQLFSK